MKPYLYTAFFSLLIILCFNQNGFGQCGSKYASVPYTQDFESWINLCGGSKEVPDSSWVNSASFENDRRCSWYIDNYWSLTSEWYTPPAAVGSYSARFHDNTLSGSANLDLHLNCSSDTEEYLSFYYINGAGTDYMNVLLSTNNGTTFTTLGHYTTTKGWTLESLVFKSNSSQTVIRFTGTCFVVKNGGDNIGLDYVQVLLPCQGKPEAGNIVSEGCSGNPFVLALAGNSSGVGGLSYTWQQSIDGATWSTIPGNATSISLPLSSAISPYYYRAIVTCMISGLSDTTAKLYYGGALFRKLPYTQSFESWINSCNNIDIPDTGWTNNPSSGNDSWRRDDQGDSAGWGCPSCGQYSPASAVGSYSARFHSSWATSGTTGALNLYLNCNTLITTQQLSFYYINNGGTYDADSMSVLLSTDGGSTFKTIGNYTNTPNGWAHDSLLFTSNSPTTVISFVGNSSNGGSDMGLDYVQVKSLPYCSGKPVAGNIVRSYNCTYLTDSLSLSGNTSVFSGTGISYTWQQFNDSINWTTILGDTTTGIAVSPFVSVYYRAIVSCSGSALSDTSAKFYSRSIIDSSFYRRIPYTQSFESWMTHCDSLDVPDTGWLNVPSTGQNSWRREDQGGSANWGCPDINDCGILQSPAAVGSHCACFEATGSGLGTLYLFVNCSTIKGTKQLSFYYQEPAYQGHNPTNIYISTDGGAAFTLLTTITFASQSQYWQQYEIPIASDSPHTVISFVTGTGTDNVGLDYVQVLPPCQDKPVAGNIVSKALCNNDSLTLSNSSLVLATGLSYIWQQSTDSINWSTITGDNSAGISVLSFISSEYYRAIVTCSNSGLSDTAAAKINGNIATSFYRSIPYTEDFETWMNRCNSLDVPDTGWINIPSTGDTSWRRDDEGGSAGWLGPSLYGVYTPAAYSGSHSARFHSELVHTGASGTLYLFVNCSTVSGTKELSFYYYNPLYSDASYLDICVSTNGGITFSPSLLTCDTIGTGWTNYTVPIASDSPHVIISFTATSDYGGFGISDMGLDLVQVLTPCTGKPVAGSISSMAICSGDSLILSGTSQASGLTLSWQQSGDSIHWTTIGGDTTSDITVFPYASTYYRAIVTCTNSGLSDTTTAVKVSGMGSFYRKIPYTEDFESWMNRCNILDVPDTGWVNNPVSGNDSWRRDDQGSSADWSDLYGAYTPAAFSGSYSARFHSEDARDGSTGTLDLYVNCSTIIGTKQLSFYYINPDINSGDSHMNVYVSTDGGATFSPSLVTCPDNITSWTQYTVPITSDSAETIISFVGTADDGSYDIGLDLVQVLPPCQGKPVAGTAFTYSYSLCSSGTTTVLLNGEDEELYQWQSSPDSITWSNLTDDTLSSFTTLPVTSSTYYRCVVTCPGSGLTDTSNTVYIYYFPNCYCTPQSTTEIGDNIGNVTISYGSTILLNNGIDSPAINGNLINTGQYYINYTDSVINLTQGYTYNISSAIITTAGGGNYADTAYAFIDYNQDQMWEASERIWSAAYNMPFTNTPVPTSGTFTVPLTADTGFTEMRFQLSNQASVIIPCYNDTNEGGETEDYLVHIAALPSCMGMPLAGYTEPTNDTLCTDASVILNVENTSVATGITYQWQSSPDSSIWTNIPGAVNTQYIDTGILTSAYYRCQVTCSNSHQSAYSTASYIYIDNLSNETVTTNNTSICGPGTATLTAAGGTGNYYWSTPSGIDSLPVSTSAIFSPYVTSSTTYYVSCGISPTDYCVTGYDTIAANYFKYPGASTYGTNGNYHPADTGLAGLVFNVQTGFTLTGVYIFPQFAGSFHVYLLNDSGKILNTALATVTAPTPNKPYWVPLDFNVTAGIGYELVAKVSEVNSMADIDTRATGTAFPFTNCNNSITITGGTKDGVQDTDYYFFYKWVIHSGCETQRIPASITVTPPPALTVSVSPLDYSCNGVPFSGTLTANGSGYTSFNWSPQTGLGSPFGQTTPCTTDSTTTYTVNATNGTCYNVATVTVTVEPPIVITQTVSSNYICVGVPVQINSTVSFLQSASIYCIPSLPGNCNEYLSALNFDNVSITNSTCIGYTNHADTAQVVAGTGYTISLTPSQNTNSYGFGVWIDYNHNGVFTDSSELAFVVASQPFSGSQKETGTITIPQNALHGYTRMRIINFLNNTPGLNAANCDIGTLFANNQTIIGSIDDITIDVTNNNPLTYIWSPTAGLSDTATFNPIATPTTTTTYSLVVTNSGECSDTAATTIYVYSAPTVNIYAPDDTLCIGTSEILDAGAGFASYLWNNGDTTEQITINSSAEYSVQVTGQDGCTGNDILNIITRTCTGINDVDAGNYSIGVYPNPFDNQFTLELNGLPMGEFVFDMTNTLGQKVLEFKDQNTTTLYKRVIDLHELPPGMYYISILLKGKNYVKQIIKTN